MAQLVQPFAARFHAEVRQGLWFGGGLRAGSDALLKYHFHFSARLLLAHTGIEPAHDQHPPVVSCFEERGAPPRLNLWLGVKRQPDFHTPPRLDAIKFRRAHTDNGESDAI